MQIEKLENLSENLMEAVNKNRKVGRNQWFMRKNRTGWLMKFRKPDGSMNKLCKIGGSRSKKNLIIGRGVHKNRTASFVKYTKRTDGIAK